MSSCQEISDTESVELVEEEPISPDDVIFDTPYKIPLDLGDGLKLNILAFNRNETRFIYQSKFIDNVQEAEIRRHGQPSLVCDFRCIVDYEVGVLSKLTISVHVILPEKLGKVYAWGVDISPGAKTYAEFEYDILKDEDGRIQSIKLDSVQVGTGAKIHLKDLVGIMQPVNFPYPIEDEVEVDFGKIQIPFLVTEHPDDHHFEIPVDIRQVKE